MLKKSVGDWIKGGINIAETPKNTIIQLPVNAFWDERLSTAAAENILLEANTSRKRRKEVIDQVAANLILQTALDRLQTFMYQE